MTSALSQWFEQWNRELPVFPDTVTETWEEYTWDTFHHNYFESYKIRPDGLQDRGLEVRYGERTDWDDRRKKGFRADGGLRVLGAAMWLSSLVPPSEYLTAAPGDDTLPFHTLYKWARVDFEFPTEEYREQALINGAYIPENVLPLGIEVWQDRVFVTVPSWKPGVPATLCTVPRGGEVTSPLLKPYPDWSYHRFGGGTCDGLTSVFRVSVDQCGRMWVLDSGQIDSLDTNPKQICPPAVVVFDLTSDRLVAKYTIPPEYILQNSLFVNIITDSRYPDCSDIHVYIADTWRFGLLVFRERDAKFWRFSHHLFFPDPLASNFTLHGVNFQWSDGIFGLALTPSVNGDRILFFHAMSSYREFYVKTSTLRDFSAVNRSANDFFILGESRGNKGQVSASAMDRRGVLFYNLVSRDSVGCWSHKKPYVKRNMGVVATNHETLVFPNDLKIDQEVKQSVWVLSNRLPMFQAGPLDSYDFNFRIMYAYVEEAVRGTVCDPNMKRMFSLTIEKYDMDGSY